MSHLQRWVGAFLWAVEVAKTEGDALSTLLRRISTGVLTVLVTLKCLEWLDWPWFWVLSPFWIAPISYLLVTGVVALRRWFR